MGEIITLKFISILISLVIIISPVVPAETVITVSGSTSMLPLIAAAAEAFNDQQKDYFVTVTGGGTGAGIINLAERKGDIAMASRELTEEERSSYGDRFQEFLIGYGDIIIAVSQAIYNKGVTDLSSEQVKNIYLGNITNWKEVEGPDENIYAIARMNGSGTGDIFNRIILGNVSAETPGVSTNTLSDGETYMAINGSDKAIGYLGLIYAQRGNIKPIALDGIQPSTNSLRNGSYKLTSKLYLYTYGDPSPGDRKFIEFLLSADGQKIVEEKGFTPLDYIAV